MMESSTHVPLGITRGDLVWNGDGTVGWQGNPMGKFYMHDYESGSLLRLAVLGFYIDTHTRFKWKYKLCRHRDGTGYRRRVRVYDGALTSNIKIQAEVIWGTKMNLLGQTLLDDRHRPWRIIAYSNFSKHIITLQNVEGVPKFNPSTLLIHDEDFRTVRLLDNNKSIGYDIHS